MVNFFRLGGLFLFCVFPVAAQLVDPTLPAIAPSGPSDKRITQVISKEPVLQSVLMAKNRQVAIISQKPVMVGSRLNDYIVTQIEADSVTLEGPSGILKLKLLKDLKQPKGAGIGETQ